jgi:serine/threonine protein kinase
MMIHHENIIKCLEIFEDDLAVYFIYEYFPEGDLYNYIIKKGKHRMNDKKIIIILEQMLQALVYLHEKIKVIHRDIKPSNFLIKKDGKKFIVKLRDFDNAEFIKEEGFKYLTKGTPLYLAPEVYLEETYDTKIDIWGIGITLYNIITGFNPFQSNKNINQLKQTKNKKEDLNFTIMEEDKILMQKILNQYIDFNIIKHLGLKQLTQHLLERNPHKRYSALEALEELNKIKKGVNLCVSKTMKEDGIKLNRIPSVFEGEVEKKATNHFGNKFKNILNRNETMNNLNKKIEENDTNNENNEDISEFIEYKNISNNNNIINSNEIRIEIKKKKL